MEYDKQDSFLLMYTTPDGVTKVDVSFEEDTVWLTQDQMAELFQKAKSTINEHTKNIYADGELVESSTMRKFGNVEFSTKSLNFYNLDMVFSVGLLKFHFLKSVVVDETKKCPRVRAFFLLGDSCLFPRGGITSPRR